MAAGSAAAYRQARRRIKIRGGHLGWLLCWGVVFADIGTSVYYTPGILHDRFGPKSAIFVTMTLGVFVLLTLKYAEVAWRYPEGGGVVTVASRAIHPFAGLLGGVFIVVDYYLTAALSALSGFFYLAVLLPMLRPTPIVVSCTIAALAVLATLNWLGIKESASVNMVFAGAAAICQLAVVAAAVASLGPAGILHSLEAVRQGPPLNPAGILTGYGAAFLAFSGLESIAQVSPAMREPRKAVATTAMIAVVVTIAVTSPLLTLWSTTLLPAGSDSTQFVSLLGTHVAGPLLGDLVAITGSFLLIFASNTAIIGAYHVFIALARMGFLPRALEHRNRWRGTPTWAIGLAVAVPIAVVGLSGGNVDLLGDLYAFGLLGAFLMTSLGLDIVRWHERGPRWRAAQRAWFGLGVLTTALVLLAWMTNLVAKPLATEFGGGLTAAGLVAGMATWALNRRHRPAVFPLRYRPNQPLHRPLAEIGQPRAEVLAILPRDQDLARAVVSAALEAAKGRPICFAYHGEYLPGVVERDLVEVQDPYLKDFSAQDAFIRAERMARARLPYRRYVYVAGSLPKEALGQLWKQVWPHDTIVVEGDQELLPPMAIDRVRRAVSEGVPILHLISRKAAAA